MTGTARAHLDPRFAIAEIDRRIFGGFVEHLGRHIYDGIFEPGHPSADADGFRTDVIELVKELGVTTIRYPGGNFVSGYRWEDGVGPVEQRPRRLDLAWHATETNEVGLHEFQAWLEKVGSDLCSPSTSAPAARRRRSTCSSTPTSSGATALTDQRAANGRAEPFGVKMWCLGNEMDGPWQLGHRNAEDYGKLASRTAKGMRQIDPDLELVACGSSSRSMPTFGAWEREVLEHTFDDVDFISCHAYYQEHDGDAQEFLASAVDMSRFIDGVVATADHVAALREERQAHHDLVRRVERLVPRSCHEQARAAAATTGRSRRASSRTSTTCSMRSSSATCSSRCSSTPTGCGRPRSPSSST